MVEFCGPLIGVLDRDMIAVKCCLYFHHSVTIYKAEQHATWAYLFPADFISILRAVICEQFVKIGQLAVYSLIVFGFAR